MNPIIHVEELHKHFRVSKHHRGALGALRNLTTREYRLVRAVDGVTFNIQPGELIGYIGPNGAGKSTTIKMLTGLLVPTSGELVANGYTPWKQRKQYVARVGAVFGQRTTLWWDLPVIESLTLLRHVYGVPEERFRNNLNHFRTMLDMDAFLDTPVRLLSLGQRMRADICAALLHDPVLLFLDEPTIGLDVIAKERIRQFVQYVNRENGTTIILTTHDLSDVARLCERVLIIDEGKLLYDGNLEELKTRFGGKRKLVVYLAEEYQNIEIEGGDVIEHEGLQVTLAFEREALTASELIGRFSAKYRIQDLEVREPEIEETVRRIYERRLLQNYQNHGT